MTDDRFSLLTTGRFFHRSADSLLRYSLYLYKRNCTTIFLFSQKNLEYGRRAADSLPNLDLSVVMGHSLFSTLSNPNQYNFRFISRQSPELSLFEFFGADKKNLKKLKRETRSLFEDSLFHYYGGDYLRAFGGFSNVLKIHPDDSMAQYYRELCEKILDKPMVQDV